MSPLVLALALLAASARAEEGITLTPTRAEKAMLPSGTTKLIFTAAEEAEYDAALAQAVSYADTNCVSTVNAAYSHREIVADINRAARSMGTALSAAQERAVLAAISPVKRAVAHCKKVAGPENMRFCLVKARTGSPEPISQCIAVRSRQAVRNSALTACMGNKRADRLTRQTCMMGLLELAKAE